MYHAAYAGVSIALCVLVFLLLLPATCYFYVKRSNFILQTRSPHLLLLLLTCTLLVAAVWAAEEIHFAALGGSISPYVIGAMSHLIVPWTLVPILFRAEAFYIMFDAAMRRRFMRLIRKRMSLLIMCGVTLLLAVVPFVVHVVVRTEYYRAETFGSNILLGEWRYFLPLFAVCILLQALQLRQLTHSDTKLTDTLGLISELKFVLALTSVFTAGFYTWVICLEYGVRVSTISFDSNREWMRLNHVVLVYQLALFGHVLLRQLVAVFQHTRHTLKVVALYDAQSKWMRPGGGGQPMKNGRVAPGGQVDSKTNSLNQSERPLPANSRELSDRSANWAKYSPKVSRHNSPRVSANWAAGVAEGAFASSPKYSSRPVGGAGGGGGAQSGEVPFSSLTEYREPRLKSLRDILRHPVGRALFSEFAARHLTLESVMFYESVEAYESHPAWAGLELRPVYDLGCSMYSSFVATGAEFEVNVPSEVKRNLKRIFGSTPAVVTAVTNATKKNKKKQIAPAGQLADNDAVGTGTATGAAAAASTNTPGGRFEAFLSLPAVSRRELYRAAQDEVYSLLKVNLYLPFATSPEFANLKRTFDKEQVARKATQATTAASGALETNTTTPDGAKHFLATPSGVANAARRGPSAATSPTASPTPASPTRHVQLQLRRELSPARVAITTTLVTPDTELLSVADWSPAGGRPTMSRAGSLGERPRMQINGGEGASVPSTPSASPPPVLQRVATTIIDEESTVVRMQSITTQPDGLSARSGNDASTDDPYMPLIISTQTS